LADRVDSVVEATELLIGIGELIQVLGPVRLRLGQRDRLWDQTNARAVVIQFASRRELAFDLLEISHPRRLTMRANRQPSLG
jgi:hypothetical protein